MRLNYCEDEDRPGQFALWDANCRRSMNGKAGQAALRELEAALMALPDKRLAIGAVCHDGDVCAVGAIALHRRVQAGEDHEAALAAIEAETVDQWGESEETDEYAASVLKIPRLVGWAIVAQNDIHNDTVWEVHYGPVQLGYGIYKDGIPFVRPMTPEERYERVLAWVRGHLHD